MNHLFYFLVLIVAFSEICLLSEAKRIYSLSRELRLIRRDREKAKRFMETHDRFRLLGYYQLLFVAPVVLIGLFTAQWWLFLVYLVLAALPFRRIGVWALRVDSILSAGILTLAMLDAFHDVL